MSRDIAPEFRRIIAKLPIGILEEMKYNFETKGSGSAGTKNAIFDISVEILRKKWSLS